MRAFALTTRFREKQFEAEACLLVYDELTLDGSAVGDDVRDVLDSHPNTPHIYVLAPFLSFDSVKSSVKAGTAAQRASSSSSGVAGQLAVIGLRGDGKGGARVVMAAMAVAAGAVEEEAERTLPPELQHGWLFNLFDVAKARVDAPPGVHFGKLSGSNFTDYNDAVLRAAFLRVCRPEELCYAVDERCSSEVLEVCLAELANWPFGKGDALPEFLLAMTTKRMTLLTEHMRSFKAAASKQQLPRYLALLAEAIPEN